MNDAPRLSAGAQPSGAIDITDAVHSRMIPDWARERLKVRLQLSDEEENVIFRRLFPSMREEAQSRFLAREERGIVICSERRIEYVPERHLESVLGSVAAQAELTAAFRSYNPLSEAVVVLTDGEFCKIMMVGEESFPEGLCE